MTVSAEFLLENQKIEYVICIEGIGWPSDYSDLTQGFDGTVFVTNDIDGTFASDMSCSIHPGLELPRGLSDKFDPKTYEYQPGSLSFTIQESETVFIEEQFQPHVTGKVDTLEADVGWTDTTIKIDNATNTWIAGDIAWIAGREAVKLGTKALDAGTVYDYTSSTREYLGTPKGKINPVPIDSEAFTWDSGTTIYDHDKFFYNRKVILLAHVPGETDAAYLYFGRLRSYGPQDGGVKWTFATVGDIFVGEMGVREIATHQFTTFGAYLNHMRQKPRLGYDTTSKITDRYDLPIIVGEPESLIRELYFFYDNLELANKEFKKYAYAFQYNYRCVPGGTAGVKTAIDADPEQPQAYQEFGTHNRMDILCNIGDHYIKLLYQLDSTQYNRIFASSVDWGGDESTVWNWKGLGTPTKYMLDNYSEIWPDNRYCVNKVPRRNVVDFLLIHLTSMNSEYYLGNTHATPGSTTAIRFTPDPGWTTNEWDGYALHAVQDDNQGYAREIISNTTDTITVKEAFPNAPTAGRQYQIRNTIYDVLPLGWGLCLHNSQIDVEACENVKKKYFNEVEVGKFAIGDTSGYNIWDLMLENICIPYGLLVLRDRTSGKITMKHVGETVSNGLVEDYIEISQDDFLDRDGVGDIKYGTQTPISQVSANVRSVWESPLRPYHPSSLHTSGMSKSEMKKIYYRPAHSNVSVGIEDASHTIIVKPPDSEVVYSPALLDTIEISAMFNSADDAFFLEAEMIGRLRRNRVPYPVVTIKLTTDFVLGNNAVQAGSLLSMTDSSKYDPIDPFSGGRGWTNMIGRVLSSNLILSGSGLGIECEVALLEEKNYAKIAPACNIISKGSDGNGAYFVVEDLDFVDDETNKKDYYSFAVDDRLELRDKEGAIVAGSTVYVITGFGTNFVSDPEQANSDRVYVAVAITPAMSTEYYITFEAWSDNCTTNMEDHFPLADSNEDLGPSNEEGRKLA